MLLHDSRVSVVREKWSVSESTSKRRQMMVIISLIFNFRGVSRAQFWLYEINVKGNSALICPSILISCDRFSCIYLLVALQRSTKYNIQMATRIQFLQFQSLFNSTTTASGKLASLTGGISMLNSIRNQFIMID